MENKKSWKRFTIALIITISLVGGMFYNFILIASGLLDKAIAVKEFYEIIITPLCLLIGAWIGADTMGKSSVLNSVFNKKK